MKKIVTRKKIFVVGALILIGIILCIGFITKKNGTVPNLIDEYNQKIDLDDYDMVAINKGLNQIDANFNMNYYKINIEKQLDDYEIMTMTYFINSRIATNKIFTITLKNKEIESIIINDEHLKNIKTDDKKLNATLMKKLNNFEKEAKETFIKNNLSEYILADQDILKKSSINPKIFNEEVTKYEDEYYYDFNTSELSYRVTVANDEGILKEIEVTLAD